MHDILPIICQSHVCRTSAQRLFWICLVLAFSRLPLMVRRTVGENSRPMRRMRRKMMRRKRKRRRSEENARKRRNRRRKHEEPCPEGALVFKDCYVAARSWELWCSEIVTSSLALGSLGVQRLLDCYVAARSWRAWYVAARSWYHYSISACQAIWRVSVQHFAKCCRDSRMGCVRTHDD